MEEEINIEQTPFLRDNKRSLDLSSRINNPDRSKTLPTYNEMIQWKQISGKKIYDEEKFDIPEEEERQIIDQIINLYRNHQTFQTIIIDHQQLIIKLRDNQAIIQKFSNQKYPKAVAAQFLFSFTNELSQYFQRQSSLQKLEQVSKRANYPLANILIALDLMRKGLKGQKIAQLFNRAISYGEYFAFNLFGYYYFQQKEFHQAYQMYKNAQKTGFIPLAYYRLAQILLNQEKSQIPKNIIAALKYLQNAQKYKLKPDAKLELKINKMNKEIKVGEQMAGKVKSTLESQSKRVASYISIKYQEEKLLKQGNQYNSVSASNKKSGLEEFCVSPKTFFVVFSPVMMMPSRSFLAQDQNGVIQLISIYNWDQIPAESLALLHRLGTKVILRQYIRKYGVNDDLPIYRVENPHTVDVIPGTQKHFISDSKYRTFAKTLFSSGLYEQCKTIYNHLITKRASQLEIIYSNFGLIHQKELNFKEAKSCYLQSLKIKKFEKSAYRLAKIYLAENNIVEAERLCKQLAITPEKKQLQKQIEQLEQKLRKEKQNFSKKELQQLEPNEIKYIYKIQDLKKKKNILPISLTKTKMDKSAPIVFKGSMVTYLKHFKDQLSEVLGIDDNLNDSRYVKQIQKIYDAAELPLQRQNIAAFQKFITFCYHEFEKNSFGKRFNQAFGYAQHFGIEFHLSSLKDKFNTDLGFELCLNMGMRCNYLEGRIQNYCIQLENKGQFAQVVQFYKCFDNQNIPFCIKIAEMLLKQRKYTQNIKYCSMIMQNIKKMPEFKYFFSYFLQISTIFLNNLLQLKKYQKTYQVGLKILGDIIIKNPDFQNVQFSLKDGEDFILYFTSHDKLPMKSTVELAKMLKLKNCLVTSLYMLNKFDEALTIINDRQLEQCKQDEKQLYFQILILRIKILKKLNYDQDKIKQMLKQSLKAVNKIKETSIKHIYKVAILKEMLNISLQRRQFQIIFDDIKKIIQINDKFSSYIIRKLIQFAINNENLSINLMERLKQMQLQQISKEVRQSLRQFYRNELINNNKRVFNEQILQYFDLKNIAELKQQIHLKKQQQENKDQFIEVIHHQEDNLVLLSDQRQLEHYFQNYQFITAFQSSGYRYAVYFLQEIQFEKKQKGRFMSAANKIFWRRKQKNGIQIYEHKFKSKNKVQSRLTGSIKRINEINFMFLNKKEHLKDQKPMK